MTFRNAASHPCAPGRACVLAAWALLWIGVPPAGCAATPPAPPPLRDTVTLRERCVDVIRRAMRYTEAGSVRAAGIEAMQRHSGAQAVEWFRASLHDSSPGVRFAGLVALGMAGDARARSWILPFTEDADVSIRLAACFALHRLGDAARTDAFATALLRDPSAEVRRNAALLLGLLDEPGAIGLLAKAMTDRDEEVRRQVLESMARLGSDDAVQQLVFWANSGPGPVRVRALTALSRLRRPVLAAAFHYALEQGEYLEVRLAAAGALGRLGRDDGYSMATSALGFNNPRHNVSGDPPAEQIMRVRQLAAGALGAMKDRRALSVLHRALDANTDPRVQLAIADAVLEVLGGVPDPQSPFPTRSAPTEGRGGT